MVKNITMEIGRLILENQNILLENNTKLINLKLTLIKNGVLK